MALLPKNHIEEADIEKTKKVISEGRPKGGFDAKKYNGIMPLLEDALVIQKKMREEWERNIGDF